jgi:hypothetical protein
MGYIYVSWPESQKYMTDEMYENGVEMAEEAGAVFVPEELYNG